MDTESQAKFKIMSGTEALNTDVPDIAFYIEGKLRQQAKIAVIGKWKVAKSFFTIQMGMAIASGSEFLGYQTTPANVLYINFEISEEMFQQRIQDMHHILGCDLSRFKYLTLSDLSLDQHTEELDEILPKSIADGFSVDILIIDPRWKAISRDSNQDEVVRAFCVNLDKLIERYKLTVIIVHHEGVATGADKAGKGSTVFDAWLDGWFKIRPMSGIPNSRQIDIWSRDSEHEVITAEFNYPIHKVSEQLVTDKRAKTVEAKQCIIKFLEEGCDKAESEVRFHVLAAGHTEYAFWRAKKELIQERRIKVDKASGQGNRKKLMLIRS